MYNFLDLERSRWEGLSPSEGKHIIVFDFKYDGPGLAKGGTGVLSVDGKEVARKTIEQTDPFLSRPTRASMWGSTLVRRWIRYGRSFPSTGTIDKLTFNLGASQLSAKNQKKVDDAMARVNNQAESQNDRCLCARPATRWPRPPESEAEDA